MANPTKISFTVPTQCTDGSPLPASDIKGYQFSFDGKAFVDGVVTVAGSVATALLAQFGLGFGSHNVGVRTVHVNGAVSSTTGTVAFSLVDERVPNPPTSLQVV